MCFFIINNTDISGEQRMPRNMSKSLIKSINFITPFVSRMIGRLFQYVLKVLRSIFLFHQSAQNSSRLNHVDGSSFTASTSANDFVT